ncbi:MAG: TonB-dependent receptor [Cyclobacteriaceae bacterium]
MSLPLSVIYILKRLFLASLATAGMSVFAVTHTSAQSLEDTIRVLEPLEITDSRLQSFSVGDKIEPVQTRTIGTVAHSNLARILANYSAVNVRSYGISGLSTASLRGSGSNHTPVFWEGINLQSSMNGSLDLTLIPVSFIDKVSLQYGSAGSLFGAGTMGGAIHLQSDTRMEPGFGGEIYQQLGSFGSRYTGITSRYQNERFSFRLRAFTNQAKNDFPYFNRYRNREERRQHAGLAQQGLLAETSFKPADHHHLSLKYWLQDNQAEIPGVAAAGGEARATQDDRFHRAVLRWDFTRSEYQLQARTALLHHRLLYNDHLQEASLSRAASWISEVDNTWYFSETQWFFLGLNHTFERAEVNNYGSEQPQRHRTALFLSYRTRLFHTLEASLGLRQTLVSKKWAPLLPSADLAYRLGEHWRFRTKVARSYNLPTFNDLYWAGASSGNPDLQPETGWSTELGVEGKFTLTQHLRLSGEVTAFSNLMDDWIQWVPLSGAGWSPINVQQVWARGMEVSAEANHSFSTILSARFWGHYSYTRATKEEIAPAGNPSDLHKQLIYTPNHQAKTSVNVRYRSFDGGLSACYLGKQYTNASNRQVLPSYATTDLSLGYRLRIYRAHQLQLNTTLYNLLDHTYEVRQGYPMPGRNYQISIIYQLH